MTSRRKESDEDIERDFASLVTMSARELADWLETEESKSVGWHQEGEAEAIGHQSGRHIIAIQRGSGALTEDDRAHLRKVVASHQAAPCATPAPRCRAHALALFAHELAARSGERLAG
jgi:hypothetical protein